MEPSLEPFGGVDGLLGDFLVFLEMKGWLAFDAPVTGKIIGAYWDDFQ